MMNFMRNVLGTAVLALMAAGCGTAPPGEGLTNGPSPTVLRAEEKPAVRDDLHEPPSSAGNAAVVNAADSGGGSNTAADSSPGPKAKPASPSNPGTPSPPQ